MAAVICRTCMRPFLSRNACLSTKKRVQQLSLAKAAEFPDIDAHRTTCGDSSKSQGQPAMTIPPPQLNALRHLLSRNTPHEELKEAMGWTVDRFQRFKTVVRECAQDLELNNVNLLYDSLNERKRNEFAQNVVKNFPSLAQFQDYWPLRLYFDRWVKERKRMEPVGQVPNAQKRKIESHGEIEGHPAKRRATPGKQKIIRVGRNPSSIPASLAFKAAQQAFAETADDGESSGSDEDVPLARGKPCKPVLASLANETWPSWCPWCGSAPPVPEKLTKELRQLFPDLLDEFRAVGILHDLHLRIVASKLDESWSFILREFSPKLSALRASQIAERIDAFYGKYKNIPIPEGDILVCTRHEDQYKIEVPPALGLKLQELGMEEIGPAVFALGVETDTIFKTVCAVPEGRKDMWSVGKGMRFSALQCEILKLTFSGEEKKG